MSDKVEPINCGKCYTIHA